MSDGSSSSGSGSLDDVGGNPSAAKSPASAADSALGNMGTVSSAATGAEKTTGKTSGVSVPTTKTKAPASVRPGRQSRMLQMQPPQDPSQNELQDLVSGIKDYLVVEEKPRPLLDESGDDDGSDGDDASSSGSSAATSADAPDLEPEIASVVVSVEPEEFHRPRFMKNPSSNLDKTDYFFSIHSQKLYYQGYVYKKNEYGSDGKPLTKQNNIGAWGMTDPCGEWLKWWAELVGHTLYLWRVPDSIASMAYEPEPSLGTTLSLELSPSDHILQSIKAAQDKPLMMNLLDVSSELFSHKFRPSTSNAPPPPVPYTSFFGLSTSGSNLFLFASPSYIASNAWVGAARLAAYEASHINTVFSLNLLRIPPYMAAWSDLNIPPFYSAWYKGEIKFSGPLAVRHAFQDSWKPCFCVITQVKYFEKVESENAVADPASVPSNKRLSKFFGGNKKKTESPELSKKEPSLIEKIKGQVLFFESKAEYKKGSPPFMTIEDGTSANALWPERLEAAKADRVTHVRIRGKVTLSGKTQDPFSKSKNGTERPQSIFGGLLPKIGSPSFSNAELPSTSSSKPPSPSHVLLQCANTHESLHWLVGILGVFHIDADIDLCDVHSALWLDPPPDWGELCLTTDEIAGFSTLVPPSQTLLDFSRLLRDKKALLKAGLFKNWAASVQHGVEQRKKYELREVEVKARELIAWVEKIKTGPVKLPAWVENELSFTFDELNEEAEDSKEEAREMLDLVKDNTPTSQPAASPKASSIQSSKKTSVDNPKVASKANGRKLSADGSEKSGSIRSTQSKALDNSDKPTSIHSKTSPTRSVAQESETGSMVEEKKSIVSIKSEKSNTSAKSSHKNVDDGSDSSGDEKSSKGSSSSDTEKAKKSKTAPPSVFKPDAYKQSSPAFSFQERQSNSSPKTKEEKVKKFVLDLTLTAPMDFKSDVTESTTWYKEEQDRLKIREKWLAGMDIEPLSAGPLDDEELKAKRESMGLEDAAVVAEDEDGDDYDELEDDPDESTVRKPFQLFASNSLLEKVSNQPTQKEVTDGPLLGEVRPEAHKPKLEGGLLGQMDRREKEFENIRRMGGYRATMMLTDYPYNGMAYPQYPPFGVPPQGMPMYPSPYGNQMYNGGYPGGPTNMPYPMPPQQGYPMQQQYYQEEGGYEDPKMLEMREKWLEAERVKDGINVDRRASGMPYAVPPSVVPGQESDGDDDSSESSESQDGIKRASSSPTVSSSSDASDSESQEEGLVSGKKARPKTNSKTFFTKADGSSGSDGDNKAGGIEDESEEDLIPLQHQNSNRTPSSNHSSGRDSGVFQQQQQQQQYPIRPGGQPMQYPYPQQMGYQGYPMGPGFYPPQPGQYPQQSPYLQQAQIPYGAMQQQQQQQIYRGPSHQHSGSSQDSSRHSNQQHSAGNNPHRQSQLITASQRQSSSLGGVGGNHRSSVIPPSAAARGGRRPLVAQKMDDSGTESEESAESSSDEEAKKKKKKALLASRMRPGKKK